MVNHLLALAVFASGNRRWMSCSTSLRLKKVGAFRPRRAGDAGLPNASSALRTFARRRLLSTFLTGRPSSTRERNIVDGMETPAFSRGWFSRCLDYRWAIEDGCPFNWRTSQQQLVGGISRSRGFCGGKVKVVLGPRAPTCSSATLGWFFEIVEYASGNGSPSPRTASMAVTGVAAFHC